eukprot:352134_1
MAAVPTTFIHDIKVNDPPNFNTMTTAAALRWLQISTHVIKVRWVRAADNKTFGPYQLHRRGSGYGFHLTHTHCEPDYITITDADLHLQATIVRPHDTENWCICDRNNLSWKKSSA